MNTYWFGYASILLLSLLTAGQRLAYAQNPAASGQISGTVSFKGSAPKRELISMRSDRNCEAAHPAPAHSEDVEVNANGTLPNVFIFIKRGLPEDYQAPRAAPVTLDQRGCMFVPHVLGVMVGQPLRVLNSDPTTHNVQTISTENRPHNQSQEPGAVPIIWRFNHPEIMIRLECNVHPWMRAYVGVTTNPFHAVTGPRGTFTIKGLPPGHFTLEAWTATLGTEDKEFAVQPDRTVTINFVFPPR